MGANYLDESGREQPIVMGSYGIGPARVLAAAIEQGADDRGIVWPPAISPWGIHLVSLAKADDPEREAADRIYDELREAGAEVLYDDREGGPGEKLTDAELLGCPLRLVVGRRGLAEGIVEAQVRRSGEEHKLEVAGAADKARELLEQFVMERGEGGRSVRQGPRAQAARPRPHRAGPERDPPGQPLHPLTIPNLVGYARLAALPSSSTWPSSPATAARRRRRPSTG